MSFDKSNFHLLCIGNYNFNLEATSNLEIDSCFKNTFKKIKDSCFKNKYIFPLKQNE